MFVKTVIGPISTVVNISFRYCSVQCFIDNSLRRLGRYFDPHWMPCIVVETNRSVDGTRVFTFVLKFKVVLFAPVHDILNPW